MTTFHKMTKTTLHVESNRHHSTLNRDRNVLVQDFPQNMPEGCSHKAYSDTFKTIHLMSLTPIIFLHAGAFRFVGNP